MARKKRKGAFVLGMVIYAIVFLGITAAGLSIFWDFIDSYERSRPKNTIDQYLENLTVEAMVSNCEDLFDQVDVNLQPKEDSIEVIRESLDGKITYARKSSVCTETSQTYVLRCGGKVIGEAVIKASKPTRFGFTLWAVREERFDFSHLMCTQQSITVPDSYSVTANGVTLGDEYVTESGIPFAPFEEFYDDYENLPTMVTYTAGNLLGELKLEVLDASGNLVADWAETDPETVLDNCPAEVSAQLESFVKEFLFSYVEFCGSSNQAEGRNYRNLVNNFLIEGSDLANRLYTALDGLAFAQSYGDVLDEVVIHRMSRIDETHYFCDATYLVSTYGKAGKVQTTNNLKVMLVETANGLRVESMTRY